MWQKRLQVYDATLRAMGCSPAAPSSGQCSSGAWRAPCARPMRFRRVRKELRPLCSALRLSCFPGRWSRSWQGSQGGLSACALFGYLCRSGGKCPGLVGPGQDECQQRKRRSDGCGFDGTNAYRGDPFVTATRETYAPCVAELSPRGNNHIGSCFRFAAMACTDDTRSRYTGAS